jgi:hypothetical protein
MDPRIAFLSLSVTHDIMANQLAEPLDRQHPGGRHRPAKRSGRLGAPGRRFARMTSLFAGPSV